MNGVWILCQDKQQKASSGYTGRRQQLNFSYNLRPVTVQYAHVNALPIKETHFTFLLSRSLRRAWLGSACYAMILTKLDNVL